MKKKMKNEKWKKKMNKWEKMKNEKKRWGYLIKKFQTKISVTQPCISHTQNVYFVYEHSRPI